MFPCLSPPFLKKMHKKSAHIPDQCLGLLCLWLSGETTPLGHVSPAGGPSIFKEATFLGRTHDAAEVL